MDHHIGPLFEALREAELWNSALIVVFADHGELFGEHGVNGHGEAPYQEVVRVPLIVKEVGQRSVGRSDQRV